MKSRRLFLEPLENRSLLATIVVTGIGDTIAVDGLVTLREAITAANTNAAAGDAPAGDAALDTINFNIAGSGVHTIAPTSNLPPITGAVTINGYTQPLNDGSGNTASENTLAGGDNAVLRIEIDGTSAPNSLFVFSGGGGSTVKGLVVNRAINVTAFKIASDNNTIAGNFIGTDATGTTFLPMGFESIFVESGTGNKIGGTAPKDRNVIVSGGGQSQIIGLGNGAGGSFVQGNYIGVNAAGTARLGTAADNTIAILTGGGGSGGNQIGGSDADDGTVDGKVGARNVIVATNTGILLQNPNNVVQGNFIGTNATGTAGLGGGGTGIGLQENAANSTIADNLISGNTTGVSVSVRAPAKNVVRGNKIGTDKDGTAAIANSGNGIAVSSPFAGGALVTIGGTDAGDRNIIAFNGGNGVLVNGGPEAAAILGNSIFSNFGLGIDLQSIGDPFQVTHNDAGDGDPGPNSLQNFPEITAVSSAGGSTTVTGTLNSVPNTTFRIEFCANDAADSSSFGEGQTLLGFKNVTTDASGNAPISATLPATTPSQFITATATRLDESNLPVETSEFSQLIADLALSMSDSPDPVAVGQDLVYTLSLTNGSSSSPSGPTTLTDTLPDNVTFVTAATSQGTFTPAGNTVTFNLGTLAIGGSVTATITVRPTAAAAGLALNNSATVTSVVFDPNTANNSDSEETAVTAAAAPQTDLQVTKSASPNAAVAGTDLTYTITVTNAGPSDAESVSLSDVLPTGTTFVSAGQTSGPSFSLAKPPVGGGGTLAASASTLATGASASFTLVVHVNASTPDDTTLTNTATVTSTTPDTNTANNSSTESTGVNTEADLRVTKSAGSSVVAAGGNVTYTITLTNLGPSDAQSASISDVLPAGTTFVSFATPGGFTAATPAVNGTGTVTASAAALAAGQSAAFQLVVGVGSGTAAGTSVTNTALASTATADTNLANNSASATVQVENPVAASALTITLVSRQAKFRNEFGLFIVDDASGRIGNLLPGAAGYARAALSRAKVVFSANTKIGTSRTVNLPAGSSYGLYLIQNANKAQFLARNPTNRLSGKLPLMFFSFRAANPDGFEHLRRPSPTRYAFEDLTFGGDQDFNDLIVDIRAQTGAGAAVQTFARSGRRM